jgi:hypothetical protein
MKKILIVLLPFVMASCASSIMKGYIGKNINEPILDYGPPSNVIELSKTQKAYQWINVSQNTTPVTVNSYGNSYGTANAYSYGNSASAYGNSTYTGTSTVTGGNTYNSKCVYTLIADKKEKDWIVTSFRKPSFMCE